MGSATREVYWNIEHWWLMYVLLIPTTVVFAYGVYRRWRLWQAGRPDPGRDGRSDWRRRLGLVWTFVLGHRRLLNDSLGGAMHLMVFYSMSLLFIGTIVVAIDHDLKIPIMHGWFYLIFQSLILELAGAFLLIGGLIAIWRRYVRRLPRLHGGQRSAAEGDAMQLVFLLLLAGQGFALGALRISGTGDPWAAWSPFSNLLSTVAVGWSSESVVGTYQFFWWFHLATAFAWIAYIPYGKTMHILTSPLNVYYANLCPAAKTLQPIDFETEEQLGVGQISDFTKKDLLDLDACTACGRCQDACPAYAAGTPLTPKMLILSLRRAMTAGDSSPLIGSYIDSDAVWACTTCSACMQQCPVLIEHVPKIIDLRRHLVMEAGEMPDTIADALKSVEDRAHPYKGAGVSRTHWCEDMDLPLLANVKSADVLLWVGCTGAFDPRNQKVIRAFAAVMQAAGLSFAILGDEEACTGDPARRMGHEFSYDLQARANVELLNGYKPKFRRIVTACPHGFNQLANEYRDFGGHFSVMHHSQLLRELIDEGRLPIKASDLDQVTYHDPCYLGRYNNEYQAPRQVLVAAGKALIEMERSQADSFCCGAGGAHAWMEDTHTGVRVNQLRAQEAEATGAKTVCTACPFCLQMLEDGLKTVGDGQASRVCDLAEVVLENLDSRRAAAYRPADAAGEEQHDV